jgi:hypothetical protein
MWRCLSRYPVHAAMRLWAALRAQIGGEVIPRGFWHGEKLQAAVGDWMVTLDEHTVMATAGKVTIPITS